MIPFEQRPYDAGSSIRIGTSKVVAGYSVGHNYPNRIIHVVLLLAGYPITAGNFRRIGS